MPIPSAFLTTSCSVYRPFGSAAPIAAGLACRLVPDISRGRGSGLSGILLWTHYMDVDDGADIRDGCTRAPGSDGVFYADGDEVRIPSGSTTRYVVVWVETRNLGTARAFKRVYLVRDTA